MILSMTGFGKATHSTADTDITVEIKSLNSKQLDIMARVPAQLRDSELDLRSRIGQRLERGKVDVNVTRDCRSDSSALEINIPVVSAYKSQIEAMGRELGLEKPDNWYDLLLHLPDALHSPLPAHAGTDEQDALMAAAGEAVEQLMAYREVEGRKLEEFFKLRVGNIARYLEETRPYEQERVVRIKARIEEGLSSLPQVEYDRGRLEQEMIFYIEKLDVNEERQRLGQHLAYFLETMAGKPGQGKKLGFIAQEMGREINTLGSKSNHADMQRLVVKMKDELEQIKEQVLNVM